MQPLTPGIVSFQKPGTHSQLPADFLKKQCTPSNLFMGVERCKVEQKCVGVKQCK